MDINSNSKLIDWDMVKRIQDVRSAEVERDRTAFINSVKASHGYRASSVLDGVEHYSREVSPMAFYKDLFRFYLDISDSFTPGQYTGIAIEIEQKNNKKNYRRYTITDGLLELESLIANSNNFCIMTPISYCGKRATKQNARFLFAMCIELDNLLVKDNQCWGITDLFYQFGTYELPTPTYIVWSGNGVHLYYVFEKPIPLYKGNIRLLSGLRRKLTKKIWNYYTTSSYKEKDIQYEGLFQSFRIPGTRTKRGILENIDERARVFEVGTCDKVTIEYLASFVDNPGAYEKIKERPHYTKADLKELYPDWYQRHFDENGKPLKNPILKSWKCNDGLYYWWLDRITNEITEGHRYNALICLVTYARKCQIPFEQLEKDCYSLLQPYDELTENETNHFTEYDIRCALSVYKNESIVRFPISAIEKRSGLKIEKNKRNGRKRLAHLTLARASKQAMIELGENVKGGRPKGTNKANIVRQWKLDNPDGSRYKCQKETGLSINTIKKWW